MVIADSRLRLGCDWQFFAEELTMAEKALSAVIQEANIQGVSTRSVDDLAKAMVVTSISKRQVSPLG